MSVMYPNTTISIAKVPLKKDGVVVGKCDTCKSVDCGHLIMIKTISLFGINEKHKCLISQTDSDPKMVIECEGYIE